MTNSLQSTARGISQRPVSMSSVRASLVAPSETRGILNGIPALRPACAPAGMAAAIKLTHYLN
jgi:hypothetical protein